MKKNVIVIFSLLCVTLAYNGYNHGALLTPSLVPFTEIDKIQINSPFHAKGFVKARITLLGYSYVILQESDRSVSIYCEKCPAE